MIDFHPLILFHFQKQSEYSLYADYGQSDYGATATDAETVAPIPLPETVPETIDEVLLLISLLENCVILIIIIRIAFFNN